MLPQRHDSVTRLLIAWNIGTILDIVLNGVMIGRSNARSIRRRATMTDDGKWVILGLAVVAALAAMGAILVEIGIAKSLKGSAALAHYGLAGLTIVSAWVFIHLSFALHYAHDFFDADKSPEGDNTVEDERGGNERGMGVRPTPVGGLHFPGTSEPDYWDFIYFSFIIGVASQTADVSISSRGMRRLSLAHSILSFFFNSAILALTINIAAGLV